MSVDKRKLVGGGVIAVVCSAVMLAMGAVELPVLAGSIAVLGLAFGTLLVGTSENGRPV